VADPLDNWHQDALFTDVAVDGQRLRLKQYRLACAWCTHRYLLVLNRDQRVLRGHRLCHHCGQFFGFGLHAPLEDAATWRLRARPKFHHPRLGRPLVVPVKETSV